jgi:hypothetical protein
MQAENSCFQNLWLSLSTYKCLPRFPVANWEFLTIIVDVGLDSKLADWDVPKRAQILLQLTQVSPADFLG